MSSTRSRSVHGLARIVVAAIALAMGSAPSPARAQPAAIRPAPEMRDLLERGITLQPTHADGPHNTSLGNLYYAAAVFYRVVPDSAWLDWMLGVRGDLDRSLTMIRHALALTPERIDYNVELAAILTCYGERNGAAWASHEGRAVLERAGRLPRRMEQDTLDLEHAGVMLASPERACGYSRDGWIDVAKLGRRPPAESARHARQSGAPAARSQNVM